ncbi:MAG: hypothetical protein IPL83_07335 [Bdellovibrionales bacterium]|nr:hypothetical protein [Bdellovibrionales bacterium]
MPQKTLGILFFFLVSTAAWATRPPIDDGLEQANNDPSLSQLVLRVIDTDLVGPGRKRVENPNIVFLNKQDFLLQMKTHLNELVADYNCAGGSISGNRIRGTDHSRTVVDALFEKTGWFSSRPTDRKAFIFSGFFVEEAVSQVEKEMKFLERIVHRASSEDIQWYYYNSNLYISAKGEREWLADSLAILKFTTEEHKREIADLLSRTIPIIQQEVEDMKIVIDRPVSDEDQWVKFEEFARRYTEVENKAYSISVELREFSLSKAVDKIRKNEELMAQIKARIDLLDEPGMRLTE